MGTTAELILTTGRVRVDIDSLAQRLLEPSTSVRGNNNPFCSLRRGVVLDRCHDRGHRFFSSSSHRQKRRRSPYAVLGLRKRRGNVPSRDEIKAAFRRLAKVYHPDLNRDNETRSREECESRMAELVDAYERLLSGDADDFLENIRVGASSRVALACELCSVEELELDRLHDVHALILGRAQTGLQAFF